MKTSAMQEIETVLQAYFDGLYYCDVDRLKGVFHPRAIYATADEPSPLIRSMPEYFPVISARPSPASRAERRKDKIETIHIAGKNTACARVTCRIGARAYVDFLSLIREGGKWRIIAKVFQITETSN